MIFAPCAVYSVGFLCLKQFTVFQTCELESKLISIDLLINGNVIK